MQIRGAKEANEPVAQVLALHQNENRNDQDNDSGLEGTKHGLDNGPSHCERRGPLRCELDDERLLRRATRKNRRIRFAASRPNGWNSNRGGRRLDSPEDPRYRRNAGCSKSLDSLYFALDGLDIVRDIGRQGGGLAPEQRSDQADGPQRDEHTQ